MQIDLRAVETTSQLHELLAFSFGFPEYYGKNWDAFWDCLCDTNLPKTIELVGFDEIKRVLPECWKELKQCIDDLSKEYPNKIIRVN